MRTPVLRSMVTKDLSARSTSNESLPFLPIEPLESRLDAGAHHPLHPAHLAPLRRRLHRHRLSPSPRTPCGRSIALLTSCSPIQLLGPELAHRSKRLLSSDFQTSRPANFPALRAPAGFSLDRHRHPHRHPPDLSLLQTHRSRRRLSPPGLGDRRLALELRVSYPGRIRGTELAP